MNSIIEVLKARCSNLINSSNTEQQTKVLTTISEILNIPNSLKKLDAEIVLNILKDLGYTKEETKSIYSSILQEE